MMEFLKAVAVAFCISAIVVAGFYFCGYTDERYVSADTERKPQFVSSHTHECEHHIEFMKLKHRVRWLEQDLVSGNVFEITVPRAEKSRRKGKFWWEKAE